MIHPTAIISANAEIDENVEIGPYSVVADNVYIGSGTVLGPHVTVDPYVSIGSDCHIFQYASVGGEPQAVKFKGEKTYVKIGRGTVVREFATINRGTAFGTGITEIGEENLLMATATSPMTAKRAGGSYWQTMPLWPGISPSVIMSPLGGWWRFISLSVWVIMPMSAGNPPYPKTSRPM